MYQRATFIPVVPLSRGVEYACIMIYDVDWATARLLRQVKHEAAIAGRYRGEAFAVILPDTDMASGRFFS